MENEYDLANHIASYIQTTVRCRPTLGIVCGSGLGKIPDEFEDQEVLPFLSIPKFPTSTVKGHSGNLVFGKWKGISVICMQGRVHPYEGHPLKLCAMPIRVMKLLGVETLILTNAAGAINPKYNAGDIMLIKDHIGLPTIGGVGPLVGPNDERFGTRFPGMNNVYDKTYRQTIKDLAKKLNIDIAEGVYTMTFGPQYEAPAESRMIRYFGGDAVGMSTVHEAIVGAHCGLRILGISLIANSTCHDCDDEAEETTHDEVIQVMNKASEKLILLLNAFVAQLRMN